MGFKTRKRRAVTPALRALTPALREVYELLPKNGKSITIVEIMARLPGRTRAAIWQRIKELIERRAAYRTNGSGPGFVGEYARLNLTE